MGKSKSTRESALKSSYEKYEAGVTYRTFRTRMLNGWKEKEAAMSELRIPKLAILCSHDYARHDLAVGVIESMVDMAKNKYDSFRVLIAKDDPLARSGCLEDADLRVEFLDFARVTDRPKDLGPKNMNEYMTDEATKAIIFWDGESSKRISHFKRLAAEKGISLREYVY
jgi:hypothetical protein